MSIIVPITRHDFVLRPSVALVPLPPQAAADPVVAQAAWALGIDAGAVEWGGGVTLVSSLTAEDGRMVSVHARADAGGAISGMVLFAPGREDVASARFLVAEVPTPLSLRLRVLRAQVVAAVLRHRDGRLSGVLAEIRVMG